MFLIQKSEFLKIKNYKIKNYLLDILFPKYCLGCGKEGLYICKECELFMMDAPGGGWEYNGIVKKAIHKIKFEGQYDIVRELVNKKDFELAKDTTITFVPMHIKKKKIRGYNQSEIIAKELGKKTGVPVIKLLKKIKQTKDQAKLSKEERLENIKNCFKCVRAVSCGRPILLVDDVYTSGATIAECSRVLRKAGYKNIQCFTLAETI
jgi:competence protein ComFC